MEAGICQHRNSLSSDADIHSDHPTALIAVGGGATANRLPPAGDADEPYIFGLAGVTAEAGPRVEVTAVAAFATCAAACEIFVTAVCAASGVAAAAGATAATVAAEAGLGGCRAASVVVVAAVAAVATAALASSGVAAILKLRSNVDNVTVNVL